MKPLRIAITGHTRGIGAAIFTLLNNEGHTVTGYSRTNGFDISHPEKIAEITKLCSDIDVFINNAWQDWAQIDLLYSVFAQWKSLDRLILNMGSNSGDRTKNYEHKYATSKTALDEACNQLNHVSGSRCRVVNLRPGWVRTERIEALGVTEPMLAPSDVAKMVQWIIEQPARLHIPTLTMLARS